MVMVVVIMVVTMGGFTGVITDSGRLRARCGWSCGVLVANGIVCGQLLVLGIAGVVLTMLQ